MIKALLRPLAGMSAAIAVFPAAVAEPYPCAGFQIDLNFDTIEALLPILSGEADSSDVEAAMSLHGIEAISRKMLSYNGEATLERLEADLDAFASGDRQDGSPFRWDQAGDRLEAIETAATTIQTDPSVLLQPVCERLSTFAPPNYSETLSAYMVLGVPSAGFTFGDPVLYIGFDRMNDDRAGLELVLVHELYHGIQGSYERVAQDQLKALSEQDRATFRLIDSLYLEGSALWVSDPRAYEGKGKLLEYFQTRLERGLQEIGNLLVLYEALLYRAANDPTADSDAQYFAGFTNQEHFYNVGYVIAREIEDQLGPGGLRDLMKQPPTQFILAYAALEGDDMPLSFSPAILNIVTTLDARLSEPVPSDQ